MKFVNVNSEELNTQLFGGCPIGTKIGEWYDPPNRLAKCAIIEFDGDREEAVVPYWKLRMAGSKIAQYNVVERAVHHALYRIQARRQHDYC